MLNVYISNSSASLEFKFNATNASRVYMHTTTKYELVLIYADDKINPNGTVLSYETISTYGTKYRYRAEFLTINFTSSKLVHYKAPFGLWGDYRDYFLVYDIGANGSTQNTNIQLGVLLNGFLLMPTLGMLLLTFIISFFF